MNMKLMEGPKIRKQREKEENPFPIWGAGFLAAFLVCGYSNMAIQDYKARRVAREAPATADRLINECAPNVSNESAVDISSNDNEAVQHAFVVGEVINRQFEAEYSDDNIVHDFSVDELARAARVLKERWILEERLDSGNTSNTNTLLQRVNS